MLVVHSPGYTPASQTVNVAGNSMDRDVLILLTNRPLDDRRGREGDTYFGLARVYFEQNRWEDAIAAAQQAHRRNHRIADAHLLLAKCYAKLHDEAGVIAELRAFIKEAPNGPQKKDAVRILDMLKP